MPHVIFPFVSLFVIPMAYTTTLSQPIRLVIVDEKAIADVRAELPSTCK